MAVCVLSAIPAPGISAVRHICTTAVRLTCNRMQILHSFIGKLSFASVLAQVLSTMFQPQTPLQIGSHGSYIGLLLNYIAIAYC